MPLLELAHEIDVDVEVRHAAVRQSHNVAARQRLLLVEQQARSLRKLHSKRQRDAEKLLLFALLLDQRRAGEKLTALKARLLHGEADFFGLCVVFAAELCPG